MVNNLKLKLSNLPLSPGVYQFLDKNKGVIYIGKAKNLRARVRQYFSGGDERPQIPFLIKEAADFTYTVVNTELESLYLERTLIQKYLPKYNIELKDGKSYAFIVIDYSTEIPQAVVQRKITPPGPLFRKEGGRSAYFGPYTSAKKIRDLIFMARKTFGLCSAPRVGKPCFYFHLHRCPGVCAGIIKLDEYRKHLNKIKLFFSGKISPTIKNIKAEMAKAAKEKKFEKAASLRDQLRALEMLEARQDVIMVKPVNWDIVGLFNDEGIWCVNLFKIRAGRMLDKENFIYQTNNPSSTYAKASADDPLFIPRAGARGLGEGGPVPPLKIRGDQGELLQNFLEDYYMQASGAPKEIYLPYNADNARLIIALIHDRFQTSTTIHIPKKGKAVKLVKLSSINAEEYLKKYLNEKAGHLDKVQRGLAQLKDILGLQSLPGRIECFDISNIQGTNAVGSMVVFEKGLQKKSEYRKFKIQNKNTPDDFGMMREMLVRRMAKTLSPSPSPNGRGRSEDWPIPDLIVIDGGRGQLSAALEAIRSVRFSDSSNLPIIGLAKRIEEIFLPNHKQPIILPHDSPGLQLLQRIRDEAHRFGLAFHRALRSKSAVRSALDNIPGLGPKTKKLLKTAFGTVSAVKNAGVDELKKVVGEKLAQQIKNEL